MAQTMQQSRVRRTPVVSNGVLGMIIFVVTEMMLFAGMISAFQIAKASAGMRGWPPYGQPRLPVEETAINTGALLLSGVVLFFAGRYFAKEPKKARIPLIVALLLGTFFVVFQGVEWAALIGQGLTLTTSTHSSFFYMIVGTHALHAIVALGLLTRASVRLFTGTLTASQLGAAQVLWYFVVAVWPVLYQQVYLS